MTVLRASAVLATALGLLATLAPASQAAARLDPNFGDNGIAYKQGTPTSRQISPARKVALDARGGLLVLGNDFEGLMVLGRFRNNGMRDDSFGSNGLAYASDFDRTNPIGEGRDLALGPKGNILTTGSLGYPFEYEWNRHRCAFLSEQNPDGSLRHRFADQGRRPVCFSKRGYSAGLRAAAISVGQQGMTAVAGRAWHSSHKSGAFVAVLTGRNKYLKKSFKGSQSTRTGVPGIVEFLPSRLDQLASFIDVEVLKGGKILAVGTFGGRFLAARFLKDGRLDPAFGKNGVARFEVDGQPGCDCAAAEGMSLDRYGRILMVGHTMKYGLGDADLRPVVIRLKKNGRLDRSFGRNGVAKPTLSETIELPDGPPVSRFLASAITLQKDGKIVISGEYNFRYSLIRLKPNGNTDPTFFDGGFFTEYVKGRNGAAWDVITDRKGRIVSSGGTDEGNFVLIRILPGK